MSIAKMTDTQLKNEKAKSNHATRKENKLPIANIENFVNIKRESIEWLWPGKIPLGKLTIIAGDPGISKSLFSCDLAGRITTGFPFPDGTTAPIGDGIFLTTEDDPGDTIRPRLEAAKADLTRCHFLVGKTITDKKGMEKKREIILQDVEILKDALDQIRANGGNPLLLVIDPLDSYFNGADTNGNEVRELLTPVADFARSEKIAVLGIKHLNKSTKSSAAYRIGGSIAFTAVSRVVWVVTKDPEEPDKRLFLCLKNNIAKDNVGLSYYINADLTNTPYLDWNKEPETRDVNQVLSGFNSEKPSSTEQEDILEFLQEHGEARTSEIATALDKSKQSVSNMLGKLKKSGKVVNSSYGVYTLTPTYTPIKTDVLDETCLESTSDKLDTSDNTGVNTDVSTDPEVDDLETLDLDIF
jgi:RecA-family ATPase